MGETEGVGENLADIMVTWSWGIMDGAAWNFVLWEATTGSFSACIG